MAAGRSHKTVLNLNGYAETREYRYINIAKSASRILAASAVSTYYEDLNDDQYPTDGSVNHTLVLYAPVAGTYVCRWLGSGSAAFTSWSGASDASSGVYTGGGANGSIVTNGRFTFTVSSTFSSTLTIRSSSMSDLVVCLASEEEALDGGQIFRSAYTSMLADLNPGMLRFMDDANMNTNYCNELGDYHAASAISYATTRFVPGKKAGLATGTNTYSVDAYPDMPVSWTDRESFHFGISNSGTISGLTIDVGGRGAKSVITAAGLAVTAGSTDPLLNLRADNVYTGTYIADYDAVIFQRFGFNCGTPLSMQIALCNATGIPGWFCIPFTMTDAEIAAFATLLCTTYTLNWVKIEPDNEVWNTGAGFHKTHLYAKAATTNWADTSYHYYYNYRIRRISEIMRPIFEDYSRSADLDIVWAAQGSTGDTQSSADFIVSRRLEYNGLNGSGVSTPIPDIQGDNSAHLHCDSLSYGIYYQGGVFQSGGTFFSTGDNAWCTARHTYRSAFSVLKAQIDAVLDGSDPEAVADAFEAWRDDFTVNSISFPGRFSGTGRNDTWNNIAEDYNKPISLYEVNHEVGPPSATWSNSAIIVLYSAANKLLTSSKTTTLPSLGFSQNGRSLSSAGGNSIIGVQNRLATPAPITAATLLVGGSNSDSLQWVMTPPTLWVIGVATQYTAGTRVYDTLTGIVYLINTTHTSSTASFADNRAANPSYYTQTANPTAWEVGDKIFIVDRTWNAGTATAYTAGQIVLDVVGGVVYEVQQNHTSTTASFATYYAANPTYYSVYTASTIEFVASGASGNTQVNITDTVGDLLGKIDAITSAPTSYEILTTFNDTTYGGQTGKVYQAILEFYDSPQYETVVQEFIVRFQAKSQSEMHSLYSLAIFDPWITAKKRNLSADTSLGGDTTQGFYKNYYAHKKWNNSQRAFIGKGEAA